MAYLGRSVSDTEKRYHPNEFECLAVIWVVERWRHFLYGRYFLIKTDDSCVVWLCKRRRRGGKYARWLVLLEDFGYEIVHVPCNFNVVAEALSRKLEPYPEALPLDE